MITAVSLPSIALAGNVVYMKVTAAANEAVNYTLFSDKSGVWTSVFNGSGITDFSGNALFNLSTLLKRLVQSEFKENNTDNLILFPKHTAQYKVTVFNASASIDAQAVAMFGAIGNDIFRRLNLAGADIFTNKLFDNTKNRILTTRTASQHIIVKETEILPLLIALRPGDDFINIIPSTDTDGVTIPVPPTLISQVGGINISKIRKDLFLAHNKLYSEFKIIIAGNTICTYSILQSRETRTFRYRNSFGAYERIEIAGLVEYMPELESDTYLSYNITTDDFQLEQERLKATHIYEIEIGYKTPQDLTAIVDLLQSDNIWLSSAGLEYGCVMESSGQIIASDIFVPGTVHVTVKLKDESVGIELNATDLFDNVSAEWINTVCQVKSSADISSFIPISSPAELLNIKAIPNPDNLPYVLINDIDFGGATIAPDIKHFAGVIYGQGFRLTNFQNDMPFFNMELNAGKIEILDIFFENIVFKTAFVFGNSDTSIPIVRNCRFLNIKANASGFSVFGPICDVKYCAFENSKFTFMEMRPYSAYTEITDCVFLNCDISPSVIQSISSTAIIPIIKHILLRDLVGLFLYANLLVNGDATIQNSVAIKCEMPASSWFLFSANAHSLNNHLYSTGDCIVTGREKYSDNRDGVTITDIQARTQTFYEDLGFDFDGSTQPDGNPVWAIGPDEYPTIVKEFKMFTALAQSGIAYYYTLLVSKTNEKGNIVGYPKAYSLLDAFNSFEAITIEQLRQLSVDDYNLRADAFVKYVCAQESVTDLNIKNQALNYNPDFCPIDPLLQVTMSVTTDTDGVVTDTIKANFSIAGTQYDSTQVTAIGNSITCVTNDVSVNFTFAGWEKDGIIVSTDKIYTFIITENSLLTAKWVREDNIQLVLRAGKNVVDVVGAGNYAYNTLVTARAILVNPIFISIRFRGWYKAGVLVSISRIYSFNITEYTELEARAGEADDYTLRADSYNVVLLAQGTTGTLHSVTSLKNGSFIDYSLSVSAAWLAVTKNAAGDITLVAGENTGNARNAIITITQNESGKIIYIDVQQQKGATDTQYEWVLNESELNEAIKREELKTNSTYVRVDRWQPYAPQSVPPSRPCTYPDFADNVQLDKKAYTVQMSFMYNREGSARERLYRHDATVNIWFDAKVKG